MTKNIDWLGFRVKWDRQISLHWGVFFLRDASQYAHWKRTAFKMIKSSTGQDSGWNKTDKYPYTGVALAFQQMRNIHHTQLGEKLAFKTSEMRTNGGKVEKRLTQFKSTFITGLIEQFSEMFFANGARTSFFETCSDWAPSLRAVCTKSFHDFVYGYIDMRNIRRNLR